MHKTLRTIAVVLLMLAGCNPIPKEAYFDRGNPEGLLDASSEVVNVNLRSRASINELTKWINRDQPSRAELHCAAADPLCRKAKHVLQQFAVPTTMAEGGSNVTLVYERVVARDCENRYIDNHINPYELNHPTFGCSVASNMVQAVSDKRQFTSPALMDNTDAEKAQQAISEYRTPSVFSPPRVNTDMPSLLETIQQSGGGGGR